MLEKISGKKIELLPKIPSENQIICNTCDGIGWLYDGHSIIKCIECYDGLKNCCPICGEPYKKFKCENEDCIKQQNYIKLNKEIECELTRFKEAKKINIKDIYKENIEMFYHDSYHYNDGYFNDIDEFKEYCEENELDIPKYIWATYTKCLDLDSEYILEQACEDLFEDAYYHIIDMDELIEFLDKWSKKQVNTKTYYVDYELAILL